jgi:hypothetical protein
MLIAALSYTNSSYFATKRKPQKTEPVLATILVTSGFAIDIIVAVGLIIGPLRSFPPQLNQLPFFAKAALVTGGNLLLVGDGIYVFYISRQMTAEIKRIEKQISLPEQELILERFDEELKIQSKVADEQFLLTCEEANRLRSLASTELKAGNMEKGKAYIAQIRVLQNQLQQIHEACAKSKKSKLEHPQQIKMLYSHSLTPV